MHAHSLQNEMDKQEAAEAAEQFTAHRIIYELCCMMPCTSKSRREEKEVAARLREEAAEAAASVQALPGPEPRRPTPLLRGKSRLRMYGGVANLAAGTSDYNL